MKPILKAVHIENFRGLRGEHDFKIGTHVTIIGGPNGTGKTSFFDALQWAILGDVQRLGGTRDYTNAGNIIRNKFCTEKETARVHVIFTTEGGDLELNKSETSHLASVAGKQISISEAHSLLDLTKESPHTVFLRTRMLSQEQIAGFVSATPRERYDDLKALSPIFQLGSEAAFAEKLDRVQKRLNLELEHVQAEFTRISTTLAELKRDSAVLEARSSIASRFNDAQLIEEEASIISEIRSFVTTSLPTNPGLREILVALKLNKEQLEQQRELVKSLISSFPTSKIHKESIKAAETALNQAIERIQSAKHRVEELSRELTEISANLRKLEAQESLITKQYSELQVLLKGIEKHIRRDACPVCEQGIDAETLREIIRQKVDSRIIIPESLTHDLQTTNLKKTALEVQIETERQGIEILSQDHSRLSRDYQMLSAQDVEFERQLGEIESFRERDPIEGPTNLAELGARVGERLKRIDDFIEQARLVDAKKRSADETSLLKVKRADIDVNNETEAMLRRSIQRLKFLIAAVGDARNVTREAQVLVVSRVLKKYEPIIAQLYERLSPHQVFKKFSLDVISAYKEGELYLKSSSSEGISVQINTVFSLAQRNAVALCVFLALNLSLGEEKQVAFIDDPVQSMDDVNTLELVDLFRQLKPYRQFVFSTHDRRLFNIFVDKMRPAHGESEVRAFWLESWDKGGPKVVEVAPMRSGVEMGVDEVSAVLSGMSAA